MTENDKPVEQASTDTADTPELKGGQRFLEGLIAVYELGVEFERHGRDRNRITPAGLAEHFGVGYTQGHVHARERLDEVIGVWRFRTSGKAY